LNWLIQLALGSHAGGWLALATVVLLSFALGIALVRPVFWLFTRERDADKSEKDYWRIHG